MIQIFIITINIQHTMNANLVNLELQHLNEDHWKVYFSIQSIVWSHYELLSKFRMHSRLSVTRVKMKVHVWQLL